MFAKPLEHQCSCATEATVRYAAELGYDVTLVKDAIASYQWEEMRAALEINLPNYATSILSAADTIAALEHTTG